MEDSGSKDDEGARAPEKPGSIVVGELDLVIPRIGTIAKREIRRAYVDDRPGQPSRVVLDTSRWRRAIWIMVDTPEQGDELVTALGFAATRPTSRALRTARKQYVSSLSFGSHVAVALYVLLVVGIAATILVPLRLQVALLLMLGVGTLVAILIGAARPWLTIGLNGVTFHRGLSRAPLSFAEVDSVAGRRHHFRNEVVFRCKKGPPCVFVVDGGLPSSRAYTTVLEHARQAFATYTKSHPPSALDILLERNGRSNEEWLRGLRELRAGNRYRIAAVEEAELRAIVEDDSRPPHLRIAADIALNADNDDESTEQRLAELDKGGS